MKKYLFSIFLLMISIGAFAETEMRLRHLEERINKLEQNNRSIQSQYDPITPNAGPKVQNGMDMFITLDFIYWTARLDKLSYSQTGIGTLEANKSFSTGHINSIDWAWDPGFKTGYGWIFYHGGWDLYLQYTWFYSNASDSKRSPNLQPAFSIVPLSASLNPPSPEISRKGHAHWALHYQIGDLELGRNYYINQFLKLRPFIGVKGTWQKQDYNVFFDSLSLNVNNQSTLFNYTMRQDHMTWGIGMRTGLYTAWQFTNWFNLYGDFALTGIWMSYDVYRKDIFKQETTKNVTADIEEGLYIIQPVFEFAIGLRMETYFHQNRLHVRLQAGWEAHIWPSQTFYISLMNQSQRYDLTLQGLTAKFRFDF